MPPTVDAKVQKRAITADRLRKVLLRIGGYAHHIAGIPLDGDHPGAVDASPPLSRGSCDWWVNDRRGRVTETIQAYVSDLQVIARHWLKDEPRAQGPQGHRAVALE